MENPSTRLLLGGMQLIAAYEFIVSGMDKIVSGRFPSGLGATLMDGASDNPNHWYMSFIQSAIVPHAAAWGTLIEWGELAIGVCLLLGAARWLFWPLMAPGGRRNPAFSLKLLTVIASLLGAFMTFNFHLWMGKAPIAVINPNNPFDEGVDLDLTLTLALLMIAAVNALTFGAVQRFCSAQAARIRRLVSAARHSEPSRAALVEVSAGRP